MRLRNCLRHLCLTPAVAWAVAACRPTDKPAAADSSRTPDAALESSQPAAAPIPEPPVSDSILNLGADGPGLHRGVASAVRLAVPSTLQLTHVGPENYAAALGRDPSRIFNFVRDEIAFEAYRGALRGPRGTLLAMAGNSVDRAALLAAMLASSGQQVRFVHGTLGQPEAERLVASMWANRPSAVADSGDAASPEVREAHEQFVNGVTRDGKLVVDLLQRAGHPTQSGQPVTLQSLARETQDHYWVEASRDGRSWTPMDPSFASATPGQVFGQAGAKLDSFPESLFHHVELRIRTEESVGGGFANRELLKYSARAADLSGVDVYLAHEAGKGAEANHVRPFLVVGKQTIDGKWFWLRPPSTGNAAVSMVDALAGGGEEAAGIAVAEFIDVDFANPDGSGETVVRELFDRVGKNRRKAGPALSDAQISQIATSLSINDFTASIYDLFFTTGAIQRAHLGQPAADPEAKANRFDLAAGLHRVAMAYTVVSDALTNHVIRPSGAVARLYLDTPRLTIVELAAVNGARRLGIDLRRERARAVVPSFDKEQLFRAQVFRGIVDGTLERAVLGSTARDAHPESPNAVFGTSLLFELARMQKVSPLLVTSAGPALPGDLPEEGRVRIEEALGAGNIVIGPARPVEFRGAKRYAWWQVEPRYGVTTAVTDEGLNGGLYQPNVEVGAIVLVAGTRAYVFLSVGGAPIASYVFNNRGAANFFINGLARLYNFQPLFQFW